jgi:hypothetical protein
MGKNVEIPLALLKNLVTLLEYWDVSLFDRSVRDDYWDALWFLKLKLLKLDLRDAYTRIVKDHQQYRHRVLHVSTDSPMQFDLWGEV